MLKKITQVLSFQGATLALILSSSQHVSGMEYFQSFFKSPTPSDQTTQQLEPEKSKVDIALHLIGGTESPSLDSNEVILGSSPEFLHNSQMKKTAYKASPKKNTSHVVVAHSLDELKDLTEFFSDKYSPTLRLEFNHNTYPKWYQSDEFGTFLQGIKTLDTLEFGTTMEIYGNGLIPFAKNLKITTLKHLVSGKHFFYGDAGMKNLEDLLTLIERNQQTLESFSFPIGFLYHTHQDPFMEKFPVLPKLKVFRLFGPISSDNLKNLARVLKETSALTKVKIAGEFEENQKEDGYSKVMTILKNSPNLTELSLYFHKNNIIQELIDILLSPKQTGIETLRFLTSWTPDSAYALGKVIGNQNTLKKLEISTISGDCSAAFFKGLAETQPKTSALTVFILGTYGDDFTDATGMKAFGNFLTQNQSIQKIHPRYLKNQEAAQILVDALIKRPIPLDTFKLYSWNTSTKIQSLFAPLMQKTRVNIYEW